MSSHHFVKEGQEPAVVIAGTYLCAELLGNVLEWSPRVIVVGCEATALLMADSIKVDECFLLSSEEAPPFPYEVDIYYMEVSLEEDVIRGWLKRHLQPFYLFGWQNERIISFFHSLSANHAHLVTGISIEHKWIYPGKRGFSKWMKKGTELWLTGNGPEWVIIGNTEIYWPKLIVMEDGQVNLETNELEIFAEPLYL